MPKLGLALSAAGAGPLRVPAGNLQPAGVSGCNTLYVYGAAYEPVNGTYTRIADTSGRQVWVNSNNGGYAISRLAVPGPPSYVAITTYPALAGPGSTTYYAAFRPLNSMPECPADLANATGLDHPFEVMGGGAPGPIVSRTPGSRPPAYGSESGSGSGSGSSGAGIGEFLYSDGNILKMWLSDESQASGIHAMDTTENNAILVWRDRSRNANVAQSYNHIANAPIAVPESVTVSGAVVSNPGGYELPVNGTYVRNGSSNGKPVYEKSSGNGGELRLFWAGAWFIFYSNQVLNENAILYAQNSVLSPPSGSFNSTGNSPSVTGGTYSGTVTVTWSPAHASFDGTQYLTIPNPLTGDSAEVFVVCKPDNVSPNGALIGNIGSASDPEVYSYNNVTNVIMGQFSLFRTSRSVLDTTAPVSIFNKWHLLGIRGGPNGYATAHNGSYGVGAGQGNFSFSRSTYNNEGPYVGRSTQGTGAYFQGKIAEIMLYNRALTDSERTVVQNYLNQKYSLWV